MLPREGHCTVRAYVLPQGGLRTGGAHQIDSVRLAQVTSSALLTRTLMPFARNIAVISDIAY